MAKIDVKEIGINLALRTDTLNEDVSQTTYFEGVKETTNQKVQIINYDKHTLFKVEHFTPFI